MKASELIKILESAISEHGDLQCEAIDCDRGHVEVESVTFYEWSHDKKRVFFIEC